MSPAVRALLPALVILVSGCRHEEAPRKALTPVKTAAVQSLSTNSELRYSANIKPETQVDLNFKVGGYIAGLYQVRGSDGRARNVQEGDFVRKDTVLAQVQQEDYQVRLNQAQAQVNQVQSSLAAGRAQQAQAEAGAQQAVLDFTRARNLFATQSLTKSDYDAAKARRDATDAQVAAARDQVRAAEAGLALANASVAAAKIPLSDTLLKAPIDGIVLRRNVEVGSLVGPGSPGFVVADTRSVKAVFGVPDTDVGALKLGAALSAATEGVPGVVFHGRITRISPAADLKSRVFDVELTIPNADNRLRSGMIATVSIGQPAPSNPPLVLPLNAIVRSRSGPDQYAVYVVENATGKTLARLRDVQLGEAFGNAIAVTEGLALGQKVITSGSNLVSDGEQVEVVP